MDLRGGGRPPYPATRRLLAVARVHFTAIDGSLAGAGVDPFSLSVRQLLNYVYVWALDRIPYDDREAWIDELNEQPRTDPDEVAPEVVDDEMALFRQAQGVLH